MDWNLERNLLAIADAEGEGSDGSAIVGEVESCRRMMSGEE